jgi:hypothetical protein
MQRLSSRVIAGLLIGLFVVCFSSVANGAILTITEGSYSSEEFASEPAFFVDTEYYKATVVPGKGGRILSLEDKVSKKTIVKEKSYGGLLDDHGDRYTQPYTAKWIKKSDKEAVIEMFLDEPLSYRKQVTFFADRPVIQVDYHIQNNTQSPQRLLFRNVVRPSGADFTGNELYCYSRISGLQRAKGMPRTSDQADPWCALVTPLEKTVVANSFEGDALALLYTWQGSKVDPTYEFMFQNLEAGKSIDVRYYWQILHGLTAADYSHRTFTAQIEGAWDGTTLQTSSSLVGTWRTMPDLKISGEVLNPERKVIAKIASSALPITEIDKVFSIPIKAEVSGEKYVILLLTLTSKEFPEGIVIEKPFPKNDDPKLLTGYSRPVRWIGEAVIQKPIPGWKKEEKYVITPSAADKTRGWMVFEESGPRRGKTVSRIPFDMMQNEPEGFPIHFHSISFSGDVEIACDAPKGISLESFIPEQMPVQLWLRTVYGLKLNPGAAFSVKPGDDKTLFFRLSVGTLKPGTHLCKILFTPKGKRTFSVEVPVTVYPVKFPERPYMVLDLNNTVNYLCARQEKGVWNWDPIMARNYLTDMKGHGALTQTIGGTNSPDNPHMVRFIKDRETGLSLPEAIKKDPSRYKTSTPPSLDFSYFDWFFEELLSYGMSHIRFIMGGCGDRFMQGQSHLTRLIYGTTFPSGDVRQLAVQEWFYREITRYLKDRGITRTLCTIDDEIPSEKMAWWVQHAFRSSQMGLEPGVTISAKTIESDTIMNIISPFMPYWIIGTFGKESLDLRRKQGLIKADDWVTTYHSSAVHFQPYDEMRGHCGIRNAWVGLDACWIQAYDRFYSSEHVVYPGPDGPISSAAWEGARDGVDDANLFLLATNLCANISNEKERASFERQIAQYVGSDEKSIIRILDKPSSFGILSEISNNPDTFAFRTMKSGLLRLIGEMAKKVPVQKANVLFEKIPLIHDGVPCFKIAGDIAQSTDFFKSCAGALESSSPETASAKEERDIFFCGTLAQLSSLFPSLAAHPTLADLSKNYPVAGNYVIRTIEFPADSKKNLPASTTILIIGGDEEGTARGLKILSRVLSFPKGQYSHWLPFLQ